MSYRRGLGDCNVPVGMTLVDPNGCQWLMPTDAAKLGKICLPPGFLPFPGRYRASGNYQNTTLTCGSLTGEVATDDLIYGTIVAGISFAFFPEPWKWIGVIGGGAIVALSRLAAMS